MSCVVMLLLYSTHVPCLDVHVSGDPLCDWITSNQWLSLLFALKRVRSPLCNQTMLRMHFLQPDVTTAGPHHKPHWVHQQCSRNCRTASTRGRVTQPNECLASDLQAVVL